MNRGVGAVAGAVGLLLAIAAVAASQNRPAAAASDPGPPEAQISPVEIITALSQTAIWIGDRVVYTVELRCAPEVDVLLDDLGRDHLRVEGGEVIAVEQSEGNRDDDVLGPIRRFRYTLTTYRIDVPELQIAAMRVRYYARRSVRAAQTAPAGEVIVPAAVIAVRSAIPEGDGVPPIRIPGTRQAPGYLRFARPVGLLLIAIAIVPVAIWSLDVGGRAKRAWGRQKLRRTRRQQQVSLEQLKSIEPASEAARIEAYEQLDGVVRDHLSATTGVNVVALTPAEIRRALEQHAPSLPHEKIEALLAACERARYDPQSPTADDWTRVLRDAEEILSSTRR